MQTGGGGDQTATPAISGQSALPPELHHFTFTNLRAQMEGVDVPSTRWRHLSLEMQREVVSQEVTGSQSGAAVQSTLTNV